MAAALTCILLAGCGGSASSDPASLGDSTAPIPEGLAEGCPPDDTPLRLADGDLPAGAIGVRLCPGAPFVRADGTRHGPFVQPVADDLTTGIEPLVDLVNGLPVYEPSDCPLDGGVDLVYWFRYPDGDALAVAYGEYGCHTLVAGEDFGREKGEELAQAFADALLAQRAATMPTTSPQEQQPAPDCPPPTDQREVGALPQVPLALTVATWCEVVRPGRMQSATVPPALVRRLNENLLGNPVDGRDRCTAVGYWQSIEGFNHWGDRVSYWVVSGCGIYTRVGYGRDTNTVRFEASPDLIRALRALKTTAVHRCDRVPATPPVGRCGAATRAQRITCDDVLEPGETASMAPDPERHVDLLRVEGVPTDQALVDPAAPDYVYVHAGPEVQDIDALPRKVQALLTTG